MSDLGQFIQTFGEQILILDPNATGYRKIAREWWAAGARDPIEAAAWHIGDWKPEAAAPLIAQGVSFEDATAAQFAALDAADGGNRLASWQAMGQAMGDAAALAAIDPDSPAHVIVNISE